MMITVHLADGRKITKDATRLKFITDPDDMEDGFQLVQDGYITINWWQVVDIRPAEQDEINHAKIHGW